VSPLSEATYLRDSRGQSPATRTRVDVSADPRPWSLPHDPVEEVQTHIRANAKPEKNTRDTAAPQIPFQKIQDFISQDQYGIAGGVLLSIHSREVLHWVSSAKTV
jgi:hypothetical protein